MISHQELSFCDHTEQGHLNETPHHKARHMHVDSVHAVVLSGLHEYCAGCNDCFVDVLLLWLLFVVVDVVDDVCCACNGCNAFPQYSLFESLSSVPASSLEHNRVNESLSEQLLMTWIEWHLEHIDYWVKTKFANFNIWQLMKVAPKDDF